MSGQRKPDEPGELDSLIDEVLAEMAGGEAPPWLAAMVSAQVRDLPSPTGGTSGRGEPFGWWWQPRPAWIGAVAVAVTILVAIALTVVVYGPVAGRRSADAPAIAARSLEAEPMALLPEAPRSSPVARAPREPARAAVPIARPGPRVVARSSEEARRMGLARTESPAVRPVFVLDTRSLPAWTTSGALADSPGWQPAGFGQEIALRPLEASPLEISPIDIPEIRIDPIEVAPLDPGRSATSGEVPVI